MRLYSLAIKLSGNIEEYPSPKANSCDCLFICHWNVNSICEHSFIKLSLFRVYISVNKIDIICLAETYLDSSITSDDDNLELPGYSLVRGNNPTSTKKRIGGKLCSFLCLYRSPSQTRDIFETFANNFELTLDTKIHFSMQKQLTGRRMIQILIRA